MPYTLTHKYAIVDAPVTITDNGDFATVRCSLSGSFNVHFPGELQVSKSVRYAVRTVVTDLDNSSTKVFTETKTLPLNVEIRKPNGALFTTGRVTLDDLNEFRDLRGTSHGVWTFKLTGESEPIFLEFLETTVLPQKNTFSVIGVETITSHSAAPLVREQLPLAAGKPYTFDLFRVGTFIATADQRRLTLFDPDGNVVASGLNDVRFPVTLQTIDKSRDTQGKPRLWSLDVRPGVGLAPSTPVLATVVASARIRTSVLQDRIKLLFGADGRNITLHGITTQESLLIQIIINDKVAAETIDIHDLLDDIIRAEDTSANVNINTGTPYIIAHIDRGLPSPLRLTDFTFQVNSINIEVGASQEIQPPIPALKLKLDLTLKLAAEEPHTGINVANAKLRNNPVRLEAGLRLEPNGSFAAQTWIEEGIVDIDIAPGAAVAAIILGLGGPIAAAALIESIENAVNEFLSDVLQQLVSRMMGKAPQILAFLLGDDFTYRAVRLEGNDIVFDYVAPVEPDPAPSKRFQYVGVVGRGVTELGPNVFKFNPPSLGDTFNVPNLRDKIKHIVVVMMENRSYDHVLGHLAQKAGGTNSDGLTQELVKFLGDQKPTGHEEGFVVRNLRESAIEPNAVGFKTQLRLSVGHALDDVAQQLTERLTFAGRSINSPLGFVDNFAQKHKLTNATTIKRNDVLGFYDSQDLPFYDFLIKNYAHCERYFCSHPGPTLPNRMYSIAGDVQYDRNGEAILDNNDGDNFALSRATTVFDLLTRKGVSWRVYESFPSVTMLRMFARYVTDNTNIVDVARFAQDVARGDVPSVVIVDPAMHHFPQADDHTPDADMYRGQIFLKSVYDTLRSNPDVWRDTLLIITYDEHGGFYDHVLPPLAEILNRPPVAQDPTSGPGGPMTPGSQRIAYGLRVPTFVVSPWAPAGKGPDIVLDHCSILKTILARFIGRAAPFLSARVSAARSFDAFLTASAPRMDVPASPTMRRLPDPATLIERRIVTPPVSRQEMRRGNIDYHDLTGMIGRMLGR